MFVSQLIIPETYDRHQGNPDMTAGWRDPWQHPVHLYCVGKLKNHLIDNAVVAHGARHRGHLSIRRHLRDESPGIKLTQLVFSHTSGQYRNVIDISVIHHGFEGLFGIARLKFVFDMVLPEIREALAPVRSSLKAQITGEMLEAPQIGDLGSNRIEMETSGPGESVVLAW